jgi:nicotinamide-nucleotide amidase
MQTHHAQRAELLAVGTELLLGEIVDTNSAWLARALADLSVDVLWSQRVGDNRARISDALRSATARSDLVVVCGGLGPTEDDLTREAIADVLGESPTVDPDLAADLRGRFARLARSMPERNLKQAWRIPAAEALPNPNGTAPGWFVRTEANGRPCAIVALPGPPHELQPMWNHEVVPRLSFPHARFVSRTFKTLGLGESHVADLLGVWTNASNPSVATYAKRDGVHVRVAAKGDDEAAALALLTPVADGVARALGAAVWGCDDDELADATLDALARREGRVAVVDQTTGGAFSTLLAAAALDDEARSRTLAGAVIAWRDEALAVLDVPHAALTASTAGRRRGSVPPDLVAEEGRSKAVTLARAACTRFDADHGVALTPWVRTAEKADDRSSWTASWAAVGPDGVKARSVTLPHPGRIWRDERLAFAALFGLRSLMTT